jgi:hypothetical protein
MNVMFGGRCQGVTPVVRDQELTDCPIVPGQVYAFVAALAVQVALNQIQPPTFHHAFDKYEHEKEWKGGGAVRHLGAAG